MTVQMANRDSIERSSSEVGVPAYPVNELDSSAIPRRPSLESNGGPLPSDPLPESIALFDRVLQSDVGVKKSQSCVAQADIFGRLGSLHF